MSTVHVQSSRELFLLTPQSLLISQKAVISHKIPLESITNLSIKGSEFVIERTNIDQNEQPSDFRIVRDLSDFDNLDQLKSFIEEVNRQTGGREFTRVNKNMLTFFSAKWREILAFLLFILTFLTLSYPAISLVIFFILSGILLLILRDNIIGPCLFLPAVARTWMGSQLQAFRDQRDHFLIRHPKETAIVTVKTTDGVNITGIKWMNPYYPSNKWLLWMNPNAAGYQDHLFFLHKYAHSIGTNFFSFNYRGVADSEGHPHTADELVLDGEAAFRYLLSLGADPSDILIHGHSMGGGVGTIVRARYPQGPIISDRSFASLGVVAGGICRATPALRIIIGALLGGWAGAAVGIYYSSFTDIISFSPVFAATVAVIFTISPGLASVIIRGLVQAIGWDMNPFAVWKLIEGDKAIVAHPLDGIILFSDMSLFKAVLEEEKHAVRIQLAMKDHRVPDKHQLYHCYSLDMNPTEWAQIVSFARQAIKT